jgi:Txe/YoeB family toxin of Txe-Axe toxin-antitoxin module
MGMSKHDLERKRQNMKRRIEELEAIVKNDPLKRKPENHEELAKLKKQLAET